MYFFFEKQMLVSLPLRSRPYKTLGVCFASFRKKLGGRSHQKQRHPSANPTCEKDSLLRQIRHFSLSAGPAGHVQCE